MGLEAPPLSLPFSAPPANSSPSPEVLWRVWVPGGEQSPVGGWVGGWGAPFHVSRTLPWESINLSKAAAAAPAWPPSRLLGPPARSGPFPAGASPAPGRGTPGGQVSGRLLLNPNPLPRKQGRRPGLPAQPSRPARKSPALEGPAPVQSLLPPRHLQSSLGCLKQGPGAAFADCLQADPRGVPPTTSFEPSLHSAQGGSGHVMPGGPPQPEPPQGHVHRPRWAVHTPPPAHLLPPAASDPQRLPLINEEGGSLAPVGGGHGPLPLPPRGARAEPETAAAFQPPPGPRQRWGDCPPAPQRARAR